MLMKILHFFLLFTSTTSFYTNPIDGNDFKIVTLSNVIQKHFSVKAGEDIKPGLPYQTISVNFDYQPNLYNKKKSPIYNSQNSLNNLNLNVNQNMEEIKNEEQSNIFKDTTYSTSIDVTKSTKPKKISRRSISNAVIESAHCEHIELIECDSYETNDMKCLVTATGMPCCVCTGKLKSLRKVKKWIVW